MKVRDLIRLLEADGWTLRRTRGSHRQYGHPTKPGLVTVPGQPGATLHPKTLAGVLRQAGPKEGSMTGDGYLIVIEGDSATNFSSWSPDLPGVVAVGDTQDACQASMREAIALHIEGLRAAGEPVPAPTSVGAYVAAH